VLDVHVHVHARVHDDDDDDDDDGLSFVGQETGGDHGWRRVRQGSDPAAYYDTARGAETTQEQRI
jgi:hypothetical protein